MRTEQRTFRIPVSNFLALGSLIAFNAAHAESGLIDLGVLNQGVGSTVYGMSADGRVVVGEASDGSAGNANRAFIWTAKDGMKSLGVLNQGATSSANAVSADGASIAGTAVDGPAGTNVAFRWTANTGMQSLGLLNGGAYSNANGISSDGSVVVGTAQDGLGGLHQAFRWTTTTNRMDSLGQLNGGTNSYANAVSADGKVVVGTAADGSQGNALLAFRWTAGTGMTSLGTLNGGTYSFANSVSSDGSVIVGEADDGNAGNSTRAFRWVSGGGGMKSLGVLNGGTTSSANAVSTDGKVVVGQADDGAAGGAMRGFRWSVDTGKMQSVEQWLSSQGVTVSPNLKTATANATNSDGSVVGGTLDNDRAFIARVAAEGSGLINLQDFTRTLIASPGPQRLANTLADQVMHGLHGAMPRTLLKKGQQSAWVGGDIGRQDHLSDKGNADAGEIGYSYGITNTLTMKTAIGRTYSDTASVEQGNTRVRGSYILPELIWAVPASPLLASASAYYNSGDVSARRGYQNAGVQSFSQSQANVATWALRLRLDWINAFNIEKTAFTPFASLTQTHSRVGAATESGGGFPVHWDQRLETNTQSRLGLDAVHHLGGETKLVGRIESVHRFEPNGSGSSGEILGMSSFAFAGESNKRDWLRGGAGLEGKAGPGFFAMMLNATTEARAPSAWLYANYRINF